MLVCGVVVAREDGSRASRLRCFRRSLVTWSPCVVALIFGVLLFPLIGALWAGAAAVVLAIASLWLPERGLQDRIAGTYLVPR